MKETNFINQNKKKWQEFEQMLKEKDNDPGKLSDLFIQITDDLSYAKTFYPNRSVRYYLNNLAQQVFYILYKRKKSRFQNFLIFWTTDLPKALYDSKKELTISLLVFSLSIVIGVFSTIKDPDFAKNILGESYINMTIENINSGDPMAVYKKMHQVDMFLGITFNNIMVAFRTFISGIFLGIGSITLLLYNGIMLGTFQYFFYEKNLFIDSFLTIWLHGTIEISSIIIAGGAGIKLGSGLIFPGTYSRLQSFKLSAKKGLTIMMGTVPLFIIAGFIESFITRYTEAPAIVKIGLIATSLLFIIGYFIYLPITKSRKGLFKEIKEEKLHPSPSITLDLTNIKSNGDIFAYLFIIYKKHFIRLLSLGFITSILYALGLTFLQREYLDEITRVKWFFSIHLLDYSNDSVDNLVLLNFALFTSIFFFSNQILLKELRPMESKKEYFIKNILNSTLISAFIQSILFATTGLSILFFCIGFPYLLLINFSSIFDRRNFFSSIGQAANYLNGGQSKLYGLFFVLLFSCIIYFLLLESPISYIYLEALNWTMHLQENEFRIVLVTFHSMLSALGFFMILPLLSIGIGICYFSLREMKYALQLRARIKNFGIRSSGNGK